MKKYLYERLVSQVPQEILNIPERVQEMTGIEVSLQPYSEKFKKEQPSFAKSLAALDIDPDNSSITLWFEPNALTASNIVHELLHLRRNILDSAPKLFPLSNCPPGVEEEVFFLENELEHLLIVPEQIAVIPESEQWWVNHYGELHSKITRGNLSLMLAWSFIRNVLPEQIQLAKTFAALIREHNFEKPADYFREDMKASMPDKMMMLQRLFETFPQLKANSAIGSYSMVEGKLTVLPA